jgi:hypothetical protein
MILIYISFMARDVEHFFMCFLAICSPVILNILCVGKVQ